jgi:putative phosphoribosyl transferase
MEQISVDTRLQDRKEAGVLLSKKLAAYKDSDAVVVGIPHGGVCVASVIADTLSLTLEVMPCRQIKNPGDGKNNIGSVSVGDVFMHDCPYTIPQDYIFHQIVLLRNAVAFENKSYYGNGEPASLRFRTVILVDDVLKSSDTMMACLRGIKKQNPLKVIVAVPFISAEAARIISAEADDLVFLDLKHSIELASDYFIDFPKIDEVKVKELLLASRKRVEIHV